MALETQMQKTNKDHLKIMGQNLGTKSSKPFLREFVRSRSPKSKTTIPPNQCGDGSQWLKETRF